MTPQSISLDRRSYIGLMIIILIIPFAGVTSTMAGTDGFAGLFDTIHYHAAVHVIVYAPGAIINQTSQLCIENCVIIWEWRGHNLLTDLGKNAVKTNFGTAANQTTALVIQLANATFTAHTSDTYCCGAAANVFTGSGSTGMGPAAGAYTSTGAGTWTVTKTFTLAIAASTTAYGAALTSTVTTGAGANNCIADAVFGTNAPLSTGDSVLVTWTVTIT